MKLEDALHEHFGHRNFRPQQDIIINTILEGKDVVVIMPTGGGKSLCYQLPALMLPGVAVVISPLIALMKDQVDQLTARGISATFINSSLNASEQRHRINELEAGQYKMVYIAPERFRHQRFTDALAAIKIGFFAIDEAHCVSLWGHDFRPDYLRLGEAINKLGNPLIAAFTATATPEVRSDIISHLHLKKPTSFITGFARPNLDFRVSQIGKDAEKFGRLGEVIESFKTGIIYCATRKRVEEVADQLAEWNIAYVAYHAGMSEEARNQAQEAFIEKKVDVAVATNAFGMGIDRADLRFVVHFQVTGSIEAYYQEAGRAGRDGKPAVCELFFSYADVRVQEFFIEGNNPSVSFITDLYTILRRLADDNGEIRVSIQSMANEMDSTTNTMALSSALSVLVKQKYIDRFDIPGERIRGTRLINPELTPWDLKIDAVTLAEKERRDRAKLDSIIQYASDPFCRQVAMLRYFGDLKVDACGHCDNCLHHAPENMREGSIEEKLILQKALSGVARMSRRGAEEGWIAIWGRSRIIQMLLGSQDQQILKLNLNQLSTYGLLKKQGSPYLKELFRQMERAGLIQSTGGDRPLLSLTPLGTEAMHDRLTVRLAWPKDKSKSKSTRPAKRKSKRRKRAGDLFDYDLESPLREDNDISDGNTRSPTGSRYEADFTDEYLLEKLKKKRMQLAMIRKIKPYQVFSNAVLEELARLKPLTLGEAFVIRGIGPKLAKKYLPTFLSIIAEHRINRG